jgi:hypothetical protein
MGHPDYVYQPQSDERRAAASERMKAHCHDRAFAKVIRAELDDLERKREMLQKLLELYDARQE